jgi:hypothetical protein
MRVTFLENTLIPFSLFSTWLQWLSLSKEHLRKEASFYLAILAGFQSDLPGGHFYMLCLL